MHIARPTLSVAKASVKHCTFAGVAKPSFASFDGVLFLVLCVRHKCVFVSVCAICFTIVLLSQRAGKHVVLFSYTCFCTDLSVLPYLRGVCTPCVL